MARPNHRTKPAATYFVTTNTWQRREIFRKVPAATLLEHKLFHYRDQAFYLVHSYVVMPNHFHVILTPGPTATLEKAMQLIKGGSSHEIAKMLEMKLPVWQTGFTEHQIRDQEDFSSHVRYIEMNPVQAKLAENPADYLFCSALGKYRLDKWPVASGAEAPAAFVASLRRG